MERNGIRIENRKWIYAALLAVSLLFSAVFTTAVSSHRLTNVIECAYQNGWLFGIENRDDSYLLFRINVHDGTSRSLRIPQNTGTVRTELGNLTVMDNGAAYILRIETEGEEQRYEIVSCDFAERSLVSEYLFTEEQEASFWMMTDNGEAPIVAFGNGDRVEEYLLRGGALQFLNSVHLEVPGARILLAECDHGVLYLIDTNGSVYRFDKDGEPICFFDNSGTGPETRNWNYRVTDGMFYYENLSDGHLYRVDPQTEPYTPVLSDESRIEAVSFDAERMNSVDFSDPGVKSGLYVLEDGRQTAAVCGSEEYLADRLEWDPESRFFCALAGGLVLFLFLLLCRFFWNRRDRSRLRISLAAEIAGLAFVLSAGTAFLLQTVLWQRVQQTSMDHILETCLRSAYGRKDRLNIENLEEMISWEGISEETKLPLWNGDETRYDALLKSGESAEGDETGAVTYELFYQKDGELYLMDGLGIYNLPLDYNIPAMNEGAAQAIQNAAQSGMTTSARYSDLTREIIAVYVPVLDRDGTVLGVLAARSYADQLRAEAENRFFHIQRVIWIMALVIYSAVCIVVVLNLKSLRILKRAVLKFLAGDMETRVRTRGRSEADYTAKRFNHMAAQLETQISGILAYQKKYEAIAPIEAFSLFGFRKEWEVLSPDIRVEGTAVLLQGSFWKDQRFSEQEKNGLLSMAIDQIQREGGSVFSLDMDHFFCIFRGNPAAVLESAVNVLLGSVARGRFSLVLGYEKLQLGVVGTGERCAAACTGEYEAFSRLLLAEAEQFGCSLLITGSAAAQIPDLKKKYHIRRIGSCLLEKSGFVEAVYEVLDADWEQRRKKELSAELFERGSDLFEAGDLREARNCFVRVLADNPEDLAAGRYIRLCESRSSGLKQYLWRVDG